MKNRICYFGSFDPSYSRNHILIKGLRENNCKLSFCQDHSTGLKHGINLIKKFITSCRDCDLIFVGVFGHHDMLLAWCLAKLFKKKLAFDAFISFYDTYTDDRKVLLKKSLNAYLIFFLDYLAVHLADIVLIDTNAHSQYFIKTFKLDPQKIKTIYIGADQDFFKPIGKKFATKFIVEFHGSFQPLQGVDFIVKTAYILKNHRDIQFIIIGEGQTKNKILSQVFKLKIKNIQFLPRLELSEIREYLQKADIALGIFGKSGKASRVIPNKLYEAIALKKPIITMDSIAIREIFENNKNVLLVSNKNPRQMADLIIKLKEDRKFLDRIALGGYQVYCKMLTTNILGKQLKLELVKLINS